MKEVLQETDFEGGGRHTYKSGELHIESVHVPLQSRVTLCVTCVIYVSPKLRSNVHLQKVGFSSVKP